MNPVIDDNRPDPGVLKLLDGTFVAVSTSNFASYGKEGAFPISTSTNLYTWTQQGFVFPKGKIMAMVSKSIHTVIVSIDKEFKN